MKFVCWALASITRRFGGAGLGLSLRRKASARLLRSRGLATTGVALTAKVMKVDGQEALAADAAAVPGKILPAAGAAGAAGDALQGLTAVEEGGAIYSRFAGNTRLSPIVRKFAARLHEQLDRAAKAQSSGDMGELARFGHWLAGAAGTVGYDAFTVPARELEALAKQGDAQGVATVLGRLNQMANQVVVPDALATS